MVSVELATATVSSVDTICREVDDGGIRCGCNINLFEFIDGGGLVKNDCVTAATNSTINNCRSNIVGDYGYYDDAKNL